MPEVIDPIDDRILAVHEAGHAVAAVLLDLGLVRVSVGDRYLPDGTHIGGDFIWRGVALPELVDKESGAIAPITLYLAGPVAERRINPSELDPRDLPSDYRLALEMAEHAAATVLDRGAGLCLALTRAAQMHLYEDARLAAVALVDEHWATIEALAALLQTRRSMIGEEIDEFVRAAADLRR